MRSLVFAIAGTLLLAAPVFWLFRAERSRAPAQGSPWWLRALIPNYRFFDKVEPGARLEVQFVGDGASGEWAPALPAVRRPWWHGFWDPGGTLRLFAFQLVDELIDELAARGPTPLADVEQLPRFRELCRLTEYYHPESNRRASSYCLRILGPPMLPDGQGVVSAPAPLIDGRTPPVQGALPAPGSALGEVYFQSSPQRREHSGERVSRS